MKSVLEISTESMSKKWIAPISVLAALLKIKLFSMISSFVFEILIAPTLVWEKPFKNEKNFIKIFSIKVWVFYS